MIETGNWIALHRKIIDSAVFADAELLRLWIWVLSRANFRTVNISMTVGRGQTIVELSPGQLVIGRNTGAAALGWKPSTFRDRLERLAKHGMVTIKPDTHWSVVSIVNWGIYQSLGDHSTTTKRNGRRQPTDSHKHRKLQGQTDGDTVEADTQPTGKRQANDNQPTQEKNAKKDKNEKKKSTPPFVDDVLVYARTLTDPKYANALGCVDQFHNHYEANGWRTRSGAIKSWKAAFRGWVLRQDRFDGGSESVSSTASTPKGQALPLRRPARRVSGGGDRV